MTTINVRPWVRSLALASILAVAAAGALAQTNQRFIPLSAQDATAANLLPPGLRSNDVSVVVLLGGDSVATVQAAMGQKLSKSVKDGVKAQRIREQDAIKPQIEAKGGRVIGSFQSVMNGIKVKIARNRIAELRAIPGVVAVKLVNVYKREHTISVPRTQAPVVWSFLPGFRGEGIKVAVVDTGLDYTHANFGGPGTTAAYQAAKAAGTFPASPALFGPRAPKVKGGIDLAGDEYDADDEAHEIPQRDPNPLDCDEDVGHGTHVAGSVGGFGVLSSGTTYRGVYDTTTFISNDFRIGPGVAPKADLYAIRVFGCTGSTSLVGEALEWAIENDMDVINMSLGAPFGVADSSDSVASNNAVKAGVVVVTSAGNSGDLRYITGAPGAAERVIATAAADTPPTVPVASLVLLPTATDPVQTVSSLIVNGVTFASPMILEVKVVRDPAQPGGVGLGCNVADFEANGGVAGRLAVVQRGTCARVAKAINGQKAGAAGVVMINNSTELPPYEGAIFQNPDDGEYYTVTIPFFGVRGLVTTASSDGAKLVRRDNAAIALGLDAPRPTGSASFSSGGPRNGDSFLKPDITAPGSPIISAFSGSGNMQESLSGTSMASPHVAGIAALARQAHPAWTPAEIKASIINTASPDPIAGYRTRRNGSGFANAMNATTTRVIAYADKQATHMNFGMEQFRRDYSKEMKITLQNLGNIDAVFNVGVTDQQGSPHGVSFNKAQVKVKAKAKANVRMTLDIPAATAGNSDDFRDVAGLVTFTPIGPSDNAGIALRVPYYLVPRVSANINATLVRPITAATPTANARVRNNMSPIEATADFYTWGLEGANRGSRNTGYNLTAAGVQTFDLSPTQRGLAFAIAMEQPWSAPNLNEFDIEIDTDGDGIIDYVVVGIDIGLITTGAFDGRMVGAVYRRVANNVFQATSIDFLAIAPTDSSTIIIPVLASSLGLSAANPRFSYNVIAFNLDTGADEAFPAPASYNAYTKALSDGQFVVLPPEASVMVPLTANFAELANTPALGVMIIAPDNRNGPDEAVLVPLQ